MKLRKRNAFTLIELVGVLVIMAIIALIVTPLVMSIIRKALISADKRSVDACGRSIELAIAGYLMDTGSFPTDINQLTIEYSGDEVVCSTTQINTDSSVYLARCTVNGRSVDGYTYGKEEVITYDSYKVGDEVTYNGVDYYVIKDSSASEESVTLLKAEPLSVQEVNQYGTEHINRYTDGSIGTAYDNSGYGGMAYYTSETCGWVNDKWVKDGCVTNYDQSEVKYVVDSWKTAQAPAAIDARLISKDEIETEKKDYDCCGGCGQCITTGDFAKYNWMYNIPYWWTNTPYIDSSLNVWYVDFYGLLDRDYKGSVYTKYGVVRPVIVLPKFAL